MLTSSEFWRLSKVAIKSGLYEKFWELQSYEKAWIIAVIETQDDVNTVVGYVDSLKVKKDAS